MIPNDDEQEALQRLVQEAGYSFNAAEGGRLLISFGGPYRQWLVHATAANAWLSLVAYICDRPQNPSARAALADLLLTFNDRNALTKYSLQRESISLETQYRFEHVDVDVLRGLLDLLISCANDDYPGIARIVTGEATLNRLEKQFAPSKFEPAERPESNGGTSLP